MDDVNEVNLDFLMMWISWWWYGLLDDVDFLMVIWTWWCGLLDDNDVDEINSLMRWMRLTGPKKTKIKRELTHSQEINTFLIVSVVVSLWISCLCISSLALPWPPSEDCMYIMKTAKVWQSLEMDGRTMCQKASWLDELWTQREQTRST